MLQTYILPVLKRVDETHDTISLHFFQPKVDRIPYYPGQYITLKLDIEGKTYFRSYSMSSSPKLDAHLAITIKRVDKGKVSNYIHDHIEEGDQIEFLRPAGRFIAELATKHRRRLMMVAGGSGITPLFSILRGILFQEPNSDVRLLYSNKTEEDIIFHQQLRELERKFPTRLSIVHFLSRPTKETKLSHQKGRLNSEWLEKWIHQMATDESENEGRKMEFFICGPAPLLEMTLECLRNQQIPEELVHFEKFAANSDMEERQKKTLQPSRKVLLEINGDQQELWVPSGATVLEAALSQGMDLPYSCKRGICASCMGRLLNGTVDMNDPSALLGFEVEAGKVLICQCIPTSENVQIKVGL